MNREEAIKELKIEYLGERYKLRESKEKAISDMTKLQKIEALYEPRAFGEGISMEERGKEVQKILEEGQ